MVRANVTGDYYRNSGFRSDAKKEWATVITGYVISEFAAIQRGNLEVTVCDRTIKKQTVFKINKHKIEDHFASKFIAAEVKNYIGNDASEIDDASFTMDVAEEGKKVIRKELDLGELEKRGYI